MELRIPLADLDYGLEEEQAALEVIRSRWLTMGSVTQEFEQAFAGLLGVKHALAVSNCTHALHLACLSLGIGPGDEVILPSLTFVATANAVLYTGAEVCFADIQSLDDLTIAPREIEKNITGRTKAIMVMHYGGYPCQMQAILEIARRHNLAVIEDAAHAPGATLAGRALGTWGDVGCFSFFSNKNLATGEGGMLVTNRDDIAGRVKLLRSHGMTSLTWDRHQGHAYSYDVVELGNNYRIDEMRAALGLAQLHKLERNNARRGQLTGHYRKALLGSSVQIPFADSAGHPAYHLLPVLLPLDSDRQGFMEHMRAAGIQTSIHYPPVHHFSYYRRRYPGITLPVTEAAAAREVTLPLYPTLSDSEVNYVLKTIQEIITPARMEVKRTI
jgi:dTDP-4-amino-4,6-dideoxygalactose transaminase